MPTLAEIVAPSSGLRNGTALQGLTQAGGGPNAASATPTADTPSLGRPITRPAPGTVSTGTPVQTAPLASNPTDPAYIRSILAQWNSQPGVADAANKAADPDYWVNAILQHGGLTPESMAYWQGRYNEPPGPPAGSSGSNGSNGGSGGGTPLDLSGFGSLSFNPSNVGQFQGPAAFAPGQAFTPGPAFNGVAPFQLLPAQGGGGAPGAPGTAAGNAVTGYASAGDANPASAEGGVDPGSPADGSTATPTADAATGGASPYTVNSFVAPDLNNTNDPGYQFRLDQGNKALQNSAAAKGTLLTGGTVKAAQDYGQNAASAEYGNVFNRALTTQQNAYNQTLGAQQNAYNQGLSTNQNTFNQGLATNQNTYNQGLATNQNAYNQALGTNQNNFNQLLATHQTQFGDLFNLTGLGLNAAAQTGAFGVQNANQVNSLLTNAGNTQAAQTIAGGNAINGGIQGAVNNLLGIR